MTRAALGLLLAFAVTAGACGDQPYSVRGLYEAPLSGFRVLAIGSGFVPSGADLADWPTGVAWICPIDAGRPIKLTYAEADSVVAEFDGERMRLGLFFREWPGHVRDLMARTGYPRPDSTELEEALGVIAGALSGPKAMTLDGQTDILRVVETEYYYDERFRGSIYDYSCDGADSGP